MALTKADIAESLYEELGLNKREARELVELYFDELKSALSQGKQVNYLALVISIYEIKERDPEEIQKLEKISQLVLEESLHLNPGKN